MLMIYDWKTQKYLTLTGKGGLAPVNYQEFCAASGWLAPGTCAPP